MNKEPLSSICPQCGSNELYLIGATLRSNTAIKYNGEINLEELLKAIRPEVDSGLLICKACKHQTSDLTVKLIAGVALSECMWENTSQGNRVPIICPVCRNKNVFTKIVLEQRTRAITFAPNTLGEFTPQDQGVIMGDVDQLVVQYACDVENCTGVININDPYKFSLNGH